MNSKNFGYESDGHRDRCARIGLMVADGLGMPDASPAEVLARVDKLQRMVMPVRITTENADSRIDNAVHTIIACYDEWEAFAKNEAQINQTPDAYDDAIDSQVRVVISGMVFDLD